MKRTKMSLKSETVRVLSNVELNSVEGGAGTGYCQAAGNAVTSNSSVLSVAAYTGGCVGWVLVGGQYQYFAP